MNGRHELARRLTLGDAVVIGLGAMIGAGVFAAPGPAAAAAGSWLLVGLALAALVAYANATSSAQLAALYPESGGTYVYARERIGDYWGFLAGWSFVVGKTASLSAMALTFGSYVAPDLARPIGIAAVVALAAVNYLGVRKTAGLTRVIVAVVLAALAATVAAALLGGNAQLGNLTAELPAGFWGVLQSGGLLFFAFAGYARLATLGEEVIDPETTIPKAIPIALGIVVVVYAIVLGSTLLAVGPQTIAEAPAPLAAAVEAGRWAALAWVVRVGAAIAAAGVLLSLLAGVSRTALSMARRGELPGFLDAVHPTHRTPHRAEVAAAVIVCAVVLVADLRGAIGFSSFAVLTYYALANASAWTLSGTERRWPRWLAGLGVVLCVVLAFTLPLVAVVGGLVLLVAGCHCWLTACCCRYARHEGDGARREPPAWADGSCVSWAMSRRHRGAGRSPPFRRLPFPFRWFRTVCAASCAAPSSTVGAQPLAVAVAASAGHCRRWRRGDGVARSGRRCLADGRSVAVGDVVENVSGSLLLGYLLTRFLNAAPRTTLTIPLLCTGVLGSYTTFSTFSIEIARLADTTQISTAVGYAVASVTAGFIAAQLGIRVAERR